jgi:hypothetical protein
MRPPNATVADMLFVGALLLIWRKQSGSNMELVIGPRSDLLGQDGKGSCLSCANNRSGDRFGGRGSIVSDSRVPSKPYTVRGGDQVHQRKEIRCLKLISARSSRFRLHLCSC